MRPTIQAWHAYAGQGLEPKYYRPAEGMKRSEHPPYTPVKAGGGRVPDPGPKLNLIEVES